MKSRSIATLPAALVLALALASPPEAQTTPTLPAATDRRHGDSDWPCVQRKVATLSPGAIWAGPPIDAARQTWRDDPQVARLVERLSVRRLPIPAGEAAIREFAAKVSNDPQTLTRLFAGLFATLTAERSRMIDGIERYARRQRTRADAIRMEQAELDKLRADPAADPLLVQGKTEGMDVSIRVFDERRRSLSFVCEVPVLIEQRLFAFARAIASGLPGKAATPAN